MASNNVKKVVQHVCVCIHATFNNTIISVTDPKGNVLTQESGGSSGYKGPRKSTPHAAQSAATKAAQLAKDLYKAVTGEVRVWGPGPGREAGLRAVCSLLKITAITDVTGIPFNGTKPPSERRQ